MNGDQRFTEAQVRRELLRENAAQSRRRWRIGAMAVLCAAILAGLAAARWLVALAALRTDAMSGALRAGDVALCLRADAPAPLPKVELKRGDLALVGYSDNGFKRQTIRRVIALAGDEVSVDGEGRVTLNGAALEEPYAAYGRWRRAADEPGGALENPFASGEEAASGPRPEASGYAVAVPEGRLFVLCDDRSNALDSRDEGFGLVDAEDVAGIALAVVWPAHRIGMLAAG